MVSNYTLQEHNNELFLTAPLLSAHDHVVIIEVKSITNL